MANTTQPSTGTRVIGWLWLLMAPAIAGMALISTVKSDTTYWIQVAAFSIVALAGAVGGVATGLRYLWGVRVLHLLSWIGFTYYVGSGLLGLFFSASSGKFSPVVFLIVGLIMAPGLGFAALAVALRSSLRAQSTPPYNSFKPNPLRGSA